MKLLALRQYLTNISTTMQSFNKGELGSLQVALLDSALLPISHLL